MIVMCATCKKKIGLKEPIDDNRVTHSICNECLQIQLKELSETKINYKGEKKNDKD